ncbi:MAG TPA: AAA family ATPase [Solirubrobacteraceae bacterium]|nr:AAA family ATPase [Solirubrobacteraceae bacterium]
MPADASSLLLERDGELATLDDLVAGAAGGSGRLVLIEGPAGIGKSGLLAGLRERAQPALQVLQARAGELEREFAYGVVRQLFEARVAARGELTGAAAPAAALFETAATPAQEGAASFAALHALYWLTLDLAAEHPVLLAIDDLHWTDRPSLRFLAYLARRLDGAPVLVAATLRSAEPGTDPGLLAEIVHDPATFPLRPGPLSRAATTALIRERLAGDADPAFCAACHEATGGNPLLLRQLLRALEAEGVRPVADQAAVVRAVGPRAVSSTVLLRLSRLSDDARAVARATAVLGESADLPRVAALAGIDERAVAAASGELIRAEIVRPEPPPGFVHPLVRDAVYHELPPAERQLEHERAAEMLHEAGAPVEQTAAQLLLAPRRGAAWATDLLQRAGGDAVRRGAAESAVAYLRRALEEPPAPEQRMQVLMALGVAEALTSGPAAAQHLREVHDALDDPRARAELANVLCRAMLFTGDPVQAEAVATQDAAALGPEDADLARGLEAFGLISYYFGAGGERPLERLEALRHPPGPGVGARALAGVAAYDWANRGGHADECVELARQAIAGGVLAGMDSTLLSIPPTLVLVLADRADALDELHKLDEIGHRRGSLLDVSSLQLWVGYARWRRGELEAAEDLLRQAYEALNAYGIGLGPRAYSDSFLAEVLIDRGDLAGARAAHNTNRDQGDWSDGARYWQHARMRLLLAEQQWDEALDAADAFADRFAMHADSPGTPWRVVRADALERLDRIDEARVTAEEELAAARVWGAPGTVGRALTQLGRLEREDGIPRLEEAVALLDGSPARLALARALAALGSAQRHARRPAEAREPLRRALELATACGAPPLAEQARSELYAAGARPRTEALAGVEALTASEKRVADLAATGDTNRDIAQTLYVTPKTVEVHLSNTYRKLGIRSRRELAGALGAA